MNLKEYAEKDGLKVWLDKKEVQQFIEAADGPQQRIAFLLGVRSGLRAAEIVEVTPMNVVKTRAGPRVRVEEGKGDKFRETPAPTELVRAVEYYGHDKAPDEPILDVEHPRSVNRWVTKAGEQLAEETGDEGWTYLRPHDLRRTWATLMAAAEVDPMLVCDWGGWEDLETFLEHYRGTYSPEVQRREVGKVEWLDAEECDDTEPQLQLVGGE